MQALSQNITLPSGDIVTISTDPVSDGGYMSLSVQHGDVTLTSALPKDKWGELMRKGESVALVASIA